MASNSPRFDLTHPDSVYDTSNNPPTWDDLCALARFDASARHAVILAAMGTLTREQALLALAFVALKSNNALIKRCIDLTNRLPPGEGER